MKKSYGPVAASLLAFGLLIATPRVSEAQINFNFSTTYAGTTLPTVHTDSNLHGGTFTVNPNQTSIFTDASGLGAIIHLVNNLGTSEFATDPVNNSVVAVNDQFVVTLMQQGGGSHTFIVPFQIRATFNAGGNSAGETSSSFTSTTFNIGANSYLVNAFQSTDPGAPPAGGGNSPTAGDVTVHIQASGPTTAVPEPGTIAMFASSGLGLGMMLLRRTRRQAGK